MELHKARICFMYQIKFHFEMTLSKANKHEKEEIYEKHVHL